MPRKCEAKSALGSGFTKYFSLLIAGQSSLLCAGDCRLARPYLAAAQSGKWRMSSRAALLLAVLLVAVSAAAAGCPPVSLDELAQWHSRVLAARRRHVAQRLEQQREQSQQWDYSGGADEEADQRDGGGDALSGGAAAPPMRRRSSYKEAMYLEVREEVRRAERARDRDEALRRLHVIEVQAAAAVARRQPGAPSTFASVLLWLLLDSMSVAVVAYMPLRYVLTSRAKLK